MLLSGSTILKTSLAALLHAKKLLFISLCLSPVAWLVDTFAQWQVNNSTYLGFVLGAIAIDHLLGSLYHAFWLRDFCIKKNLGGLFTKMVIVVSVGYLFEGLDALTPEATILKDYTVTVLRLMVFLYPAMSAFGNSYEMTGRKFPPYDIMEKLRKFTENATINLNPKKDE